jgi:hypothetical protein
MFDANDTPVKQKNDHTSESQQILPQWSFFVCFIYVLFAFSIFSSFSWIVFFRAHNFTSVKYDLKFRCVFVPFASHLLNIHYLPGIYLFGFVCSRFFSVFCIIFCHSRQLPWWSVFCCDLLLYRLGK